MKVVREKTDGRGVPAWLDALDFDSPNGWRVLLVRIARRLMTGKMRTDMARALTDVARAGLYSFTVEQRWKVDDRVGAEKMTQLMKWVGENVMANPGAGYPLDEDAESTGGV